MPSTRITEAVLKKYKTIRWLPCEVCGHSRTAHAPEKGTGYRCWYRGKKRNGQRCDCMRFRGDWVGVERASILSNPQ